MPLGASGGTVMSWVSGQRQSSRSSLCRWTASKGGPPAVLARLRCRAARGRRGSGLRRDVRRGRGPRGRRAVQVVRGAEAPATEHPVAKAGALGPKFITSMRDTASGTRPAAAAGRSCHRRTLPARRLCRTWRREGAGSKTRARSARESAAQLVRAARAPDDSPGDLRFSPTETATKHHWRSCSSCGDSRISPFRGEEILSRLPSMASVAGPSAVIQEATAASPSSWSKHPGEQAELVTA